MAVTFVKVNASKHQIKYRITSAGAENGNLDAAGAATPDLLTDLPLDSPLRAFFAASYASQAAARTALFEGDSVNVYMTPRDADAAWVIDANVNGTAMRINAASAAADTLGSYLIIEFRHSLIR